MAGAERGIPLILVNGRVSERSFQRWRFVPRTIGALLSRFDLCLAQSAEDAARYAGLGAPRYVTTGNLKLDVPAPPADPTKLWQLQAAVGTRPVIAAASTHPGEEIELVDVHRRLKHSFPGLLTILVPRHPERGASIAGIARGAGLTFAQRSLGELPERDTEIYVADTLGELGLIYRVAPIVFIGGSLVGHGGQNPIEAAKLGAAILHGPHVWNFAEIYSALDAAGGAEMVTDTGKLTVRIGAWLNDAEARKKVAQTGLKAMDTLAGALERTVAALDPYLMQFRLERREGQGQRTMGRCGQCVSRRSGGGRPGLIVRPAVAAGCRLWRGRGVADGAAGPRRRHSRHLRRQSDAGRRRQDADGDRGGANSGRGGPAAVRAQPRLWRRARGSGAGRSGASSRRPTSATSRCCWRASRRPSWRATASPARTPRARPAPARS